MELNKWKYAAIILGILFLFSCISTCNTMSDAKESRKRVLEVQREYEEYRKAANYVVDSLVTEIELRNREIGKLSVKKDENRKWEQNEREKLYRNPDADAIRDIILRTTRQEPDGVLYDGGGDRDSRYIDSKDR